MFFSKFIEKKEVEYPSVTFCRNYAFLDNSKLEQTLKIVSNQPKLHIEEWVQNQTQSKEEMFDFVHHATADRKFPCDTKIGAGMSVYPRSSHQFYIARLYVICNNNISLKISNPTTLLNFLYIEK